MRVHILGICGTFMGGIAVLAKQLGWEVSGSDANIYPPMSDQLVAQGIKLIEGFDVAQLQPMPDVVIVGNAMKRGNPCVEYLLNNNLPLISGPAWLAEHILNGRWVLAVAGTHGKTTTTSMLTWILEYAGFNPNFLIGGVPENFGVSARFTGSDFFVIEADEYDTAFFDKRAKFIHYHARTLILNNLEFDHADIYHSLAEIQRQFQYLLRTVAADGKIVAAKNEPYLAEVIATECWTPVEYFALTQDSDWSVQNLAADASQFDVYYQQAFQGTVQWSLLGAHNALNALAALAAAHHVGVPAQVSISALAEFKNVKRRLELLGVIDGVSIYDDFAHHPTAISATIEALRGKNHQGRLFAVLECGSYTMRTGVHQDTLAQALINADQAFILRPKQADWDIQAKMEQAPIPVRLFDQADDIVAALVATAQPGDQILVMSNSGFSGIHQKLLNSHFFSA
jgi:UDP-N-acetylmuramate: L-alanyl-gamma-D-glutamyl-meso-diaminopimelate ligase